MFRESTGDAIEGRELAYSKGGDESSDLGDAGVTVGSIGFGRVSAAKRASACRFASKDVAVQGGVEEVPSPICKMRSHDMMGGEGCNVQGGQERGKLTSIELVDAANPLEAAVREIVEGNEVVVPRNTVDGEHANLAETLEEVLGDINGLFQSLDSFVCHDRGGLGLEAIANGNSDEELDISEVMESVVCFLGRELGKLRCVEAIAWKLDGDEE